MSLNLNYVRVIPFSLYLLLRYEIIWHGDEFKSAFVSDFKKSDFETKILYIIKKVKN